MVRFSATQRFEKDDEATLHVEHAGAMGTVPVHAERHVLERAPRPDGVDVAEQEKRRRLALESRVEMFAAGLHVRPGRA